MVNYPEHGVEIVRCPHGHVRYDHDQSREKDAWSENIVFGLWSLIFQSFFDIEFLKVRNMRRIYLIFLCISFRTKIFLFVRVVWRGWNSTNIRQGYLFVKFYFFKIMFFHLNCFLQSGTPFASACIVQIMFVLANLPAIIWISLNYHSRESPQQKCDFSC